MKRKDYMVPVTSLVPVTPLQLLSGSGNRTFSLFADESDDEIESEEEFL